MFNHQSSTAPFLTNPIVNTTHWNQIEPAITQGKNLTNAIVADFGEFPPPEMVNFLRFLRFWTNPNMRRHDRKSLGNNIEWTKMKHDWIQFRAQFQPSSFEFRKLIKGRGFTASHSVSFQTESGWLQVTECVLKNMKNAQNFDNFYLGHSIYLSKN